MQREHQIEIASTLDQLHLALELHLAAAFLGAGSARSLGSLRRLLIQADDVPRWIFEPRRNLRRIGPDLLNDASAIGPYRLERRGNAIDHDVDEKPGIACGGSTHLPGAAHATDSVVERGTTVAARSHLPAEYRYVELRRPFDIERRQLDVADFSVRRCRRHFYLDSSVIPAARRCRRVSYSAIPTAVDRLSERTCGERIGMV